MRGNWRAIRIAICWEDGYTAESATDVVMGAVHSSHGGSRVSRGFRKQGGRGHWLYGKLSGMDG